MRSLLVAAVLVLTTASLVQHAGAQAMDAPDDQWPWLVVAEDASGDLDGTAAPASDGAQAYHSSDLLSLEMRDGAGQVGFRLGLRGLPDQSGLPQERVDLKIHLDVGGKA